jgi:hypothetical protein
MTVLRSAGFGRRAEAARVRNDNDASTPTHKPVKQAVGIVAGMAIVLALVTATFILKKNAGRVLNAKFLEAATPGSPERAIERNQVVDPKLQAVQRACTEHSMNVKLNLAQTRATEGFMDVYAGESELARAADFIECLATTRPARFCQQSHKAHLIEAMRQYHKLLKQTQESWALAASPTYRAVLMSAPYRLEQRQALGLPSARTNPAMLEGLRALAAGGYVSVSDFAGFGTVGVPQDLREALSNIESRRRVCG